MIRIGHRLTILLGRVLIGYWRWRYGGQNH